MKRKLVAVVLAVCLVVAVSGTFTDVPAGAWYAEAVQFVAGKGLMNGVGAGKFDPEGRTTRGQLVTILHRLEGEPAASDYLFVDVDFSDYFCDAVQWASANGIVNGVGNGRFAPEDPVTREQLVTILYRYAKYKWYDTSQTASLAGFSDFRQIDGYAQASMRWAKASGLISGTGPATLAPTGKTTRGEIATILMRFCNRIEGTVGNGDPQGIPLDFEFEGDTVFTVSLPGHWEGSIRTEMYDREEGSYLILYDGPNYDADPEIYPGNFMALCMVPRYGEMEEPNKQLLARIRFHGKHYDIVRTGPTDVRFNSDDFFLTNSYLEKEMDVRTVLKSIRFSDAVQVVSGID